MRAWLKPALAAVTLGALLLLVDWQVALARLTAADPLYAACAVLVCMGGLLVAALRWWRVVEGGGGELPLLAGLRIHWAGVFWNQFLPTGFGGDVVRFALARRHVRSSLVAASIMVERLTGLVVVLALAWVAGTGWAATLGSAIADISHALVAMASVAIAAAVLTLILGAAWLGRHDGRHHILMRRLPAGLGRRIEALAEALAGYVNRPAVLIDAAILSVPCHLASMLVQYMALRAVDAPIGLTEVLMVAPLMPLIGLLPLTPNGIGVTEAAYVGLYLALGVPPETALAAAALGRLAIMAAAAGGGVAWLLSATGAAEPRRVASLASSALPD